MVQDAEKPSRKPRADSIRNRELLLEAAKAVFSAGGSGASLEAVARAAGVGIGTLYRHFPTRDALFEAVYRREVEQLSDLAVTLAATTPPEEALRRWLQATVELAATKKGMLAALELAAEGRAELYAYSSDRMQAAAGTLVARARAAGAIRADLSAEEMLRAVLGLVGAWYRSGTPGWQDTVRRLVDVFVDGMRAGA